MIEVKSLECQTVDYDKMSEKHWRLYYICWNHNVGESTRRPVKEKTWAATQSFGPIESKGLFQSWELALLDGIF